MDYSKLIPLATVPKLIGTIVQVSTIRWRLKKDVLSALIQSAPSNNITEKKGDENYDKK